MNKTLDEIKVGDRFINNKELIQTREIKVYEIIKVYKEKDMTLDGIMILNVLVRVGTDKPIIRLHENENVTFLEEGADIEQVAYDVLRKHTLEQISNSTDTLLAEIRKLPDTKLNGDCEMMQIFTELASAYGYSTDTLERL